jgi:hypothetical protein
MKSKLIQIIAGALLFFGMIAQTQARPFYIGIKIGIFAKWSIVLGDCKSGWGICISIPTGPVQNSLGFDSDTEKLYIKISKTDLAAKNVTQGIFEVKEDSPVDPMVIQKMTNVKVKDKTLVIRKGSYKATDEGDSYIIGLDYYWQ